MTRAEWRWVAGVGVGLALVTGLPYLVAVLSETPDLAFAGFLTAVEDGNHYLAVMRQGAAGRWLFSLPYTAEPHAPMTVYGLYLLLGRLASALGVALPLALQAARLGTAVCLVVSAYRFAAHFTARRAIRRWTCLLVVAGGGFGWLWLLLGQPLELGRMPTDLWVPDASGFLSAFTFPHMALAQAAFLWVIVAGLRLLRSPTWRGTVTLGLVGLFLSWLLPMSLPVALGLLGLTGLTQGVGRRERRWRPLLYLAAAAVIASVYLVVIGVEMASNPAFEHWRSQDHTTSPAAVHYLLGFGLLTPLAAVGLTQVRRLRPGPERWLLAVWVILVPALIYAPWQFQRRLVLGYQAALVFVAVLGLRWALVALPRRWRRPTAAIVIGLCLLTTVALVVGFSALAAARPPQVFIPRPVRAAMDWLGTEAAPDSIVLAAYDTGNRLPARALVRTFVGHGSETLDVAVRRQQVAAFFGHGMNDAERVALLDAFHVAYVFHGPAERALGDFDPARLPCLARIYDTADVAIYRVVQPTP